MSTNPEDARQTLIDSAKEAYNLAGRAAVAVYSPHGEETVTTKQKLALAETLRQQIGTNARIVHVVDGPTDHKRTLEQEAAKVAIHDLNLGRYSPLHTADLDRADAPPSSDSSARRAAILEGLYQVKICVVGDGEIGRLTSHFTRHTLLDETQRHVVASSTQNTRMTLTA